MNAFKRAITNIIRQPVKNVVLLFLIMILATASSGAISAKQAINITEESILLRTPAVASVSYNFVAAAVDASVTIYELEPPPDLPTLEEIIAVGSLPYVRVYDFTMSADLFSRDLDWAVIEIDEEQLSGVSLRMLESSMTIEGTRSEGGYVERFTGRGVANSDLADIDAGLIELIAGRTFTQDEIDNKEQVVIISQLFAETNGLYIGATIEFENIAHNYAKMYREGIVNFHEHHHEERFMAAYESLEFEIIGIFDIARELNYQNHDPWTVEWFLSEDARLQNRIYMPITVAEDILAFRNEGLHSVLDEMLEVFGAHFAEDMIQEELWMPSIFVLYDPRDLDTFQDAASDLLPGFWYVSNLRDVNSSLISSMDTMRQIADFILIAAVVATIAILTLIITLLLRDRRYEIGVYMALGERKGKIIFQFLTEIIIVSTVAIVIALFIGNAISATISMNLLEQNLIENAQVDRNEYYVWELMLFNTGEVPIEEAMAMYDTSLNTTTIFVFISVSAVVILLSTIIPIAYVVKLEPKQVLAS